MTDLRNILEGRMVSFDSRFWRFQLIVAWTHRCGPVMREIFMVEHGVCGGEAEMFTSWHLRSRDKRKVRGQGITCRVCPSGTYFLRLCCLLIMPPSQSMQGSIHWVNHCPQRVDVCPKPIICQSNLQD